MRRYRVHGSIAYEAGKLPGGRPQIATAFAGDLVVLTHVDAAVLVARGDVTFHDEVPDEPAPTMPLLQE